MIDKKQWKVSWKSFEKAFIGQLVSSAKRIEEEGNKRYMPEIVERRDRSASGNWAESKPVKRERLNKYVYDITIRSWDKDRAWNLDARNVGRGAGGLAKGALDDWFIQRGITDKRVQQSIIFKIMREGTKIGQNPMHFTVYEELADAIFDTEYIIKMWEMFLRGYNG